MPGKLHGNNLDLTNNIGLNYIEPYISQIQIYDYSTIDYTTPDLKQLRMWQFGN